MSCGTLWSPQEEGMKTISSQDISKVKSIIPVLQLLGYVAADRSENEGLHALLNSYLFF